MFPYLVCKFEKGTLSNLVKECFGSRFPDIIQKRQINYIFNYLKEIDASSVVLESKYVDRDFLEDFSNYYVKCFNGYGSKCARLHFFSSEINHSLVESAVNGCNDDIKYIQDNYLGFIVIKPLPKTFIGRACLKIYPRFKVNDREILKRDYQVNLFGIDLSVESIAFQEQDKVISACATTSIWSCYHAIEWKNLIDIPSCSEITSSAINHIQNSVNRFPNDGLSNKQILRALDVEGLRHHEINARRMEWSVFFAVVNSYLKSKLPIILGVKIFEKNKDGALYSPGGHAVTILGCKRGEEKAIYLHDDRIGPFARATKSSLECIRFKSATDEKEYSGDWALTLQEKDESSNWLEPHQFLIPESLIVASYRKNRFPESYIRNTCDLILDVFDEFIIKHSGFSEDEVSNYRGKLSFSIKLDEINNIKRFVLNSNAFNKYDFLLKGHARIQWVAEILFEGVRIFDILFDATDIPQGEVVSSVVVYDHVLHEMVINAIQENRDNHCLDDGKEHLFDAFVKHTSKSENDYYSFLDETYGELRAPQYLKDEEVLNYSDDARVKVYYGRQDASLENLHDVMDGEYLIWVISHEGALLIGEEIGDRGHPGITGFKPARIAGELHKKNGKWVINSKSGRYSKHYSTPDVFLENALIKFKEIFSGTEISCESYKPVKVWPCLIKCNYN
jgi:hypothetical protein